VRLFLDANILFSAAWKDESGATRLFELGRAGFCQLITSRLALEEASQNILHKRATRLSMLRQYADLVEIGREPDATHLAEAAAFGLPDKDIPILAAALSQRADLLVTGDRRDFGHLYGQRPGGVEVIGLAGAIDRITQGEVQAAAGAARSRPQ
jgi:predicted nucleic acid-binding protein